MADAKQNVSYSEEYSSEKRKLSIREDPTGVLSTIADPDAGLSEEEKKKLEKKLMWSTLR